MKKISLQFSKQIDISKKMLCEILPIKFHDVVFSEIDVEPREKGVKNLTLTCDRCEPKEILDFLRKGSFEMAEAPKTQKEERIDVNEACNALGKHFYEIIGQTGNIKQQLDGIHSTLIDFQSVGDDRNLRIEKLEEIVNGSPAKLDKQKPAVLGLRETLSDIKGQVEKNRVEIASLVSVCKNIERHLAAISFPKYERIENVKPTAEKPTK